MNKDERSIGGNKLFLLLLKVKKTNISTERKTAAQDMVEASVEAM